MTCYIEDAAPSPAAPLAALRFDQDSATYEPHFFACCEAKRRTYPRGPVRLCPRAERLERVNGLLKDYQHRWQQPFTPKPLPPGGASALAAFVSQPTRPKGLAFQSGFRPGSPSDSIWTIALTSAWCFATPVHVVSLGTSKPWDILPKAMQTKGIILVEQGVALRLPNHAQELATLINWCEGACMPLWIDVLQESSRSKSGAPKRASLQTRDQYTARIARKKRATQPLTGLDPDDLSRLHSICRDFTGYC